MKLSFLPAELFLTEEEGSYVIRLAGEKVLETKAEKKAIKKFNEIRTKLEETYPARKLTSEEKQAALQRLIGDRVYTEVRNSLKNPNRFKSSIPKTRTFG